MKKTLCIITAIAAAFLLAGSGALAQQGQQGNQQNTQQQAQQLIDQQVMTQDGTELGTVERVIVSSKTRDIKYLILSRGGTLGVGQARVTLPWEKVSQQEGQLTANIDFSELSQLAGQQDQQGQQQGPQMLDQILGQEVTDNQGNSIGTIDNLVIGTEAGSYAILTGPNDQRYPMPLSALQRGQEEGFRADLAQQDLKQAPSFQGDQKFPDLANQNWQQEIRGYYGQQQQPQQQQQQQTGPQDQTQIKQDQQQAEGTDVQVRQPAPQVTVEQQKPQVQVQQQQPEIIVRQKQPEVQVKQQKPEVEIRQPEPQVSVRQPEPDVQVQTPQPRVQVQQPEPDVQVKQQEPEVAVRQPDQPQVDIQRKGEPQVEIVEPGQQKAAQQQQQQQQQAAQQQIQDPGKLIGMNIQDNQGNKLGTVKDVIIAGEDQNYIIMSSADDDRLYPIPMQQLQQTDKGDLKATFDRQRLQNAPSFAQGELDKINQEQFRQDVRAYYGTGQQGNQQQQNPQN